MKTRVIGLTGNIACGKSTVAKFLREAGMPVIDADEVSRQVDYSEVKKVFGTDDRKKLRDIVFADESKRKQLEAILHPLIRAKSIELIAAAGAVPIVVYEAPLLVEAGIPEFMQGLLVVTCPTDKQLERILARDSGITKELAEKMRAAQMPQAKKVAVANWILSNDGDLDTLKAKVLDWIKLIQK